MPWQCCSIHCIKFVIQTLLIHHLAFFTGTLYILNVAHGMWKNKKITMMTIHYGSVIIFIYGQIAHKIVFTIIGATIFTLWYCFTLLICIHFIPERFDRYLQNVTYERTKQKNHQNTIFKKVSKLNF